MNKLNQQIILATVLLVSSSTGFTQTKSVESALSGYVMEIHMTPAICDIYQEKHQQRKCIERFSLNIGGLYPFQYDEHCHTKDLLELSLLQTKVISRLIPDEQSRLTLWQKVGGCIGVTEQQYFRMITTYARHLKIPLILSNANTQIMQLSKIKQSFLELNPALSTHAINFDCKAHQERAYLSAVKVCYQTNGAYQKCPIPVQGDCPNKVMIKGTY